MHACAQPAAMLTRDFLLACRQFNCALDLSVQAVVTRLKLRRRRRGCRAGFNHRHRRQITSTSVSSAYNREIPVVVGNRHAQSVTFGNLNIRSLLNKTDDVLELFRDRSIDVLCLYVSGVCVLPAFRSLIARACVSPMASTLWLLIMVELLS